MILYKDLFEPLRCCCRAFQGFVEQAVIFVSTTLFEDSLPTYILFIMKFSLEFITELQHIIPLFVNVKGTKCSHLSDVLIIS